MAKIAAICISDVRGIQKHEIPEAFLKKDWGIEGDAHARQLAQTGESAVGRQCCKASGKTQL